MSKKYAVVTAISQFRMRYVIPMDDLQAENPDMPVELAWADDTVACEEAEEFSQTHVGETIIDTVEMNEEDVLALFDKDNDYLAHWPTEKKIEMINRWKRVECDAFGT